MNESALQDNGEVDNIMKKRGHEWLEFARPNATCALP
jgi:hypothetical protein